MTALQLLREKKRQQLPLTAAQEIILDAWYQARDAKNDERMARAEIAANELADMEERIAGLKSYIKGLEQAMENIS